MLRHHSTHDIIVEPSGSSPSSGPNANSHRKPGSWDWPASAPSKLRALSPAGWPENAAAGKKRQASSPAMMPDRRSRPGEPPGREIRHRAD